MTRTTPNAVRFLTGDIAERVQARRDRQSLLALQDEARALIDAGLITLATGGNRAAMARLGRAYRQAR